MPSQLSKIELLASLPESDRKALLAKLSEADAEALIWSWRWNARPNQILPGTPGASEQRNDWLFWLALAGRGWGKTKVGAESVREWGADPRERILLIAPTSSDIRDVMIEGPSGLLACFPPDQQPIYIPGRNLIKFPSGAIGLTRSAEEPERLRGPQFTKFWFDELAACKYAQECWDQLQFGFRIAGSRLRGLITTTPKPIPLVKKLVKHAKTVVTRGSSYENRSNLSPTYYEEVIAPYEGTRLGRQEIYAEILDDVPGALWTRNVIEANRMLNFMPGPGFFQRIVVAIDPAVTSNPDSDETGIIVAGLGWDGNVYVLEDDSLKGSPLEWGRAAIAAGVRWRCDRVVGEVNNGGDLVASNLYAINPAVPFRAVRATRGKLLRAEPAAALYERGIVKHCGTFPKLEDQMCEWTPQSGEKSPDRLDALVWALYDLVIGPAEERVELLMENDHKISSV